MSTTAIGLVILGIVVAAFLLFMHWYKGDGPYWP